MNKSYGFPMKLQANNGTSISSQPTSIATYVAFNAMLFCLIEHFEYSTLKFYSAGYLP